MNLVLRLATATIALSTGCAAITASRTEIVRVDSRPEGAEVRADGQSMGATPVDLEVSRKRLSRVRIRVEKEGYHSEECRLDASPGVGYVIADALLCLVFFPV